MSDAEETRPNFQRTSACGCINWTHPGTGRLQEHELFVSQSDEPINSRPSASCKPRRCASTGNPRPLRRPSRPALNPLRLGRQGATEVIDFLAAQNKVKLGLCAQGQSVHLRIEIEGNSPIRDARLRNSRDGRPTGDAARPHVRQSLGAAVIDTGTAMAGSALAQRFPAPKRVFLHACFEGQRRTEAFGWTPVCRSPLHRRTRRNAQARRNGRWRCARGCEEPGYPFKLQPRAPLAPANVPQRIPAANDATRDAHARRWPAARRRSVPSGGAWARRRWSLSSSLANRIERCEPRPVRGHATDGGAQAKTTTQHPELAGRVSCTPSSPTTMRRSSAHASQRTSASQRKVAMGTPVMKSALSVRAPASRSGSGGGCLTSVARPFSTSTADRMERAVTLGGQAAE
jgi:hypothetical protein